jgi:hypothetical protein
MDRPEVPPEKRPSVSSAHPCPALGLQVAGRIEHLLHAGAALRTFVANHHHIAGNDLVGENAGHRIFLALENTGATGEFPDGLIDTGGLDDAPFSAMLPYSTARPS